VRFDPPDPENEGSKAMKRWKIGWGSLVLMAGLAPAAYGQLPGAAPAPAAAGVPAAAAGAPAGAPAAPGNIWSKICMTPEQKAACKEKMCNCALGKMLNGMLAPASAMTGGLVPTICPAVSAADLAKPADSAAGAEARIKQDEIEAKARRAAVRELGYKDCHWWPEAQLALINALRFDRNECVRLEAAWAFGNGCCCTKPVIEALVICVSGSDRDGAPSENSPRVRAAAEAALAHCLACYTEVVPVAPDDGRNREKPAGSGEKPVGAGGKTPDKLPNIGKVSIQGIEYYKQADNVSREQVVEEGRRVLDRGLTTTVPVSAGPTGSSHSVTDIVRNAFNTGPAAPTMAPVTQVVETPAPPMPVVPVAVPPTPQVPVTKAAATTPPTAPVVKSATPTPSSAYQATTSAPAKSMPAPAPVPAPATEAPKKPVSYQTPMFVPNTPAQEKAPVTTVALKTEPAPTPSLAVAAAQPNFGQSGTTPAQVMVVLHTGAGAQQRIWAAQTLSSCDGWTNPEVMQALVKSARSDSDAGVRAACVRSIGRMNVCTLPVITAMQEMKSDRDPQVRAEVDQALRQLGEVGALQMR
jgi:hypothetical protein